MSVIASNPEYYKCKIRNETLKNERFVSYFTLIQRDQNLSDITLLRISEEIAVALFVAAPVMVFGEGLAAPGFLTRPGLRCITPEGMRSR